MPNLARTRAARVGSDEHRPQTRGLCFALELAHERFGRVVLGREGALIGVDLCLHESRETLAALLHVGGRRESRHRRTVQPA